jgi:hypothetical protein
MECPRNPTREERVALEQAARQARAEFIAHLIVAAAAAVKTRLAGMLAARNPAAAPSRPGV